MKNLIILIFIALAIGCEKYDKNRIYLSVENHTSKDIRIIFNNLKSFEYPLLNMADINNDYLNKADIMDEKRDEWIKFLYNFKENDTCLYVFVFEAEVNKFKSYPFLRRIYRYNINQLDSISWHIVIDKFDD